MPGWFFFLRKELGVGSGRLPPRTWWFDLIGHHLQDTPDQTTSLSAPMTQVVEKDGENSPEAIHYCISTPSRKRNQHVICVFRAMCARINFVANPYCWAASVSPGARLFLFNPSAVDDPNR